MNLPPELLCINHHKHLIEGRNGSSELICEAGCRVPIVNNIPRFVGSESYAAGFGLQWTAFRKTQLDSHSGLTISHDRLVGALGDVLDVVRDKSVLEVGCGAGRFTEVLLAAGARVVAFDLSTAVDANFENCRNWPKYFVCQADIRHAPLAPHSFDFVICLGVIQHTPSPEETIAALASYVRPGGALVIDHYALDYPRNFAQRNLRRLLIRLPANISRMAAISLARLLIPLHKLTWNERRGVWRIRRLLRSVSPLIDYYEVYQKLGKERLAEWSILDTHDTLTDYYKHLRTTQQIEECLRSCGLREITAYYGGNGIEARARRPASQV
jgi:SAM-dependent methyltransferase